MTMKQVRNDLELRAAVDTTLHAYPKAPQQIEVPAFYVGLQQGIDYRWAYGPTGAVITFACVLAVAVVDADEAIDLMDLYVDPQRGSKAFKVLLEDQSTYNTASMDWTHLMTSSEPGTVDFGGVEYLAVDFIVEVKV